jgi:GNAT superfamily N-acetyltransferase
MSASTDIGRIAGAPDGHEVLLRDGTPAEIVPMHRTDAGRLARFHHALSPETTRLRFFNVHPELSPKELYRFTHVDHVDREAVVAVVDDEIIAVARWDRMAERDQAEVAFVVADSWQGRGLGTLLLAALVDRAGGAGIVRFHAETLGENRRMLEVFRHAGLPMTTRFEDGVVHVVIELAAAAATGERGKVS